MIGAFTGLGGGGGGGSPTGDPLTLAWFDALGQLTDNPLLQVRPIGTYGRPEIWDHRATPPGGQPPVWRQGAWGIDGDPDQQKGSGFVCYGCNANSLGPDNLQGGMGFYTPNSFGELNIIPGVAGGNTFYICGFEDGSADAPFGLDGFVVRDNFANDLFTVQRAAGKITASIPLITASYIEPTLALSGWVGSSKKPFGLIYGGIVSANGAKHTVVNLPPGAIEGDMCYAINGRKVGEAPGFGTGVPVYFSAGSWRVFSTDLVVTA